MLGSGSELRLSGTRSRGETDTFTTILYPQPFCFSLSGFNKFHDTTLLSTVLDDFAQVQANVTVRLGRLSYDVQQARCIKCTFDSGYFQLTMGLLGTRRQGKSVYNCAEDTI